MPACPDDDGLAAWLEGSLASDVAAEIEAHVDDCPKCFALVNEIARVYAPSVSGWDTDAGEPAAALAPRTTFDRYRIEELVGTGGMGAVYRARDSKLRRTVALKVLHGAGESSRGRITREARLLARLGSAPHIVPIYDVGESGGRFFIVMEFIRGRTVDAWLAERARSPREIVSMFLGALRGVAEAHRCGVVHRDLKPSNILVDEDGHARVVDFGLARSEGREDSLPEGGSISDNDTLTLTGAVVGTPRYMAPEQHLREAVDERTDQFALCACLYEALYDEHPFDGDDYVSLRDNVVAGSLRPAPVRAGVSGPLRDAITRGLQADPARRWPTLAALERALVRSRRRWAPLAAAGVVAVTVMALSGGSSAGGESECRDPGFSEVWNDAAKARIRRALRESGTGFADETASILERRIDSWVGRWSHERERLCADPSATAGRLCLERGPSALAELIETLSAPMDAAMARRAIGVASALPDPELCELATTAAADDGRQEDRAELEAELARVVMLKSAGRGKEARDALAPLVEQAREIGGGAPLAEALRHRASFLSQDAKHEEAARTYSEAHYEAQAHGADKEALHSAIQMVYVLAVSLGRLEEAQAWADTARGLLPRVEGGHYAQKLDMQLASIAYEERKVADAIALTEGVVDVYRRSSDVVPTALGKALNNLALMNERAGNLETALGLYDEAVEVQTNALGATHPDVATMHSNRATVLLRSGRIDDARRSQERAREIMSAAYGPDHPELFHATYGLAMVEQFAKRDEQAAGLYAQALKIRTAVQGRDDPEVAHVLYELAGIAEGRGQRDDAEAGYLEALGILERVRGAEHPEVAIALEGLGSFYFVGGDHEAARRYFDRALSIQRASLPANDPDLASTLKNLSRVLEALGDDEGAEAAADEATAITAAFEQRWPEQR